jgi:hypothetical protein
MTERLTYKNEDKFYLKWGVDQELDKLGPEVQEIVRSAIEKLGKYEDDEKFLADRDNNAEWQKLILKAELSDEMCEEYENKYATLRKNLIKIRTDFISSEETFEWWPDGDTTYEEQIIIAIRKRLEELKELKEKPKKPSKSWIFNRFGQI